MDEFHRQILSVVSMSKALQSSAFSILAWHLFSVSLDLAVVDIDISLYSYIAAKLGQIRY